MNSRKKILSIIVMFSLILNSVVFPPQAYAGNPFKALIRGIKKTTRFIIKLPEKSTRWMGPVLGPVAQFVLTKNLMKNPKIAKIFRKAQRVQRVFKTEEEIKQNLADVRKMYRDEAQKLRDKADQLTDARKALAKDLLKHGDWDKYQKQVADMHQLIKIHKDAADKFDSAAQNLRTKDIVKMVSEDFLKAAWVDVRNAVLTETSKELSKVTDPTIIADFLKGGGMDSIVDFFVDREMNKVLDLKQDEKIDWDKLRENIRERVKEELEKNKKLFKEGWRDKINEILDEQVKKMKETEQELKKEEEKVTKGEEAEKKKDASKLTDEQKAVIYDFEEALQKAQTEENERILAGEVGTSDKCPAGYAYRPSWGKDCIQVNCPNVQDAHWDSTGGCVCGSSGSIAENPEDPNKECAFPREYSSCPSCIYACVHFEEDCPLQGVTSFPSN